MRMSEVYTMHVSEKPVRRTRKQQPRGSKLGKEYVKAVIE